MSQPARCPDCLRAFPDDYRCEHGRCERCHRCTCPPPPLPLGVDSEMLGIQEYEGLRIGTTFEYPAT